MLKRTSAILKCWAFLYFREIEGMWVIWVEWASSTMEKWALGGLLCNVLCSCVFVHVCVFNFLFGVYMHVWTSILKSGAFRDFREVDSMGSIKRALVVLECRTILQLIQVGVLVRAALFERRTLLEEVHVEGMWLCGVKGAALVHEGAFRGLLCYLLYGVHHLRE